VTAFWCEHARLPGGVSARVRVDVADGVILAVTPGADPRPGDERLAGLVLPGFADAHSHAFHRALRGRTHDGGGTFWTWRERMYAVAARLDPDAYLALARATYAELSLAGVTAVGEFHYLHHDPAGRPYADPNAMAEALIAAAGEAGVRLTLLDACYLAGGLGPAGHLPLEGVQRRFGDGDAAGWARRHELLKPRDGVRVGAAIHSVRAVPAEQLADVVATVRPGEPLHAHVSEQVAENEACLAVHGRTPVALLADAGVWGPEATAVHATHLTASDVALLGGAGASVCACPSTEADLADGIGPFRRLRDAGSPLCLGSDQHVAADLLAEARLLEGYERLASGRRGRFTPGELVAALTADGHRALGWPDAGRLAPGARADLVAVRLDSPRTAGAAPDQAVSAATSSDVTTVVADGRVVVREGRHRLGDVGRLLGESIEPIWESA
jgi:formiminoglutamate deiminase